MTKRAKPKASETADKAAALKIEIGEAKKAAAKLEREQIKRLGRLALDAGLADVRVNDKDMAAGLESLAERFH